MKRNHNFTLMAVVASAICVVIGFVAYKPELKPLESKENETPAPSSRANHGSLSKRLSPSDDELIKVFPSKKADLEKLVDWSKQDVRFLMKSGLERTSSKQQMLEKAEKLVDQPGRKAYYALLHKTSVEMVLPQPPSYDNFLFCLNPPQEKLEYLKGYAYCPNNSQYPKSDNLDIIDGGRNHRPTLKPIEGDWFVFVQRTSIEQTTIQQQ